MRRYLVLAMTAVIVSTATAVLVRAQSNAAQARVIQSAAEGRYQIILNPSVRADLFLLEYPDGKNLATNIILESGKQPRRLGLSGTSR
jgi:hypothetical protein